MNLESIINNYLTSRSTYLHHRALLLKHAPSLPDLLDGIKQPEAAQPSPVKPKAGKPTRTQQGPAKRGGRLITLLDGTPLADFVASYATQQGGTLKIREVMTKLNGLVTRVPTTLTMTVIMRRAGLVKAGQGARTYWRYPEVKPAPQPVPKPDLVERLRTQLAQKSQDIHQLAHNLKTDKWSVLAYLREHRGTFKVQKGQWSLVAQATPDQPKATPDQLRKEVT